MSPKFGVGDRVFYNPLQASGKVTAIVNKNDKHDVRAQGYRYEVEFLRKDGQVWSVLESELKLTARRAVRDFVPEDLLNLPQEVISEGITSNRPSGD